MKSILFLGVASLIIFCSWTTQQTNEIKKQHGSSKLGKTCLTGR